MLNLQQISKAEAVLLPTLINSIEDNRVFKKVEYRESFTKNINQLLSLRESRHSALLTLNIFCDHHSIVNQALITEKTCSEVNWTEQLLRIIEQEPQFHAECFQILKKLLKITSSNPDTNKILQSKFVQKIIDAIVGSRVAPVESLQCLATCFELHGGTSGIYKNKIYDYCVSFIDVPDTGIAERAGLCLHLLQQSRGGSVAGGVYKKCWAEFHEKNIGSLEETVEQIIKKSNAAKIGKSEQLQLPALKLSSEPFNRYTQLLVRFQNLVSILKVSLERPFPTPKIVQVSRVLAFIEEGVSMNQALMGKKSITDSMVLSLLIGKIHTNLLEVLVVLMKTVRQNIITHSKTICDIVWRCLKQTSSNDQQKFEANLKLRAAAYETLIVFLRISPNNFFFKGIMENILKEAFADISPANNEIYLMVPQQNGGKSNKRKKLNADKKFSKGRTHTTNIAHEQNVCSKALEFLGFLLVYQGTLMKPVLFFLLQEKVTSIGFAMSSNVQNDGDLYRDPHCRSMLSDLVGLLMIHPVHKMPVPINYGLALLTKLKHSDPDANVRLSAEMNLYRAETAIHNKKDVSYFPADYRELRDTLLFNKQTIQKFNELSIPKEVTCNGTHIESSSEKEIEISDEEVKIVEEEPMQGEALEKEEVILKEPEQSKEPQEVNEISDVETQEITDDDEVVQHKNMPPAPNKRPSRATKSPTVAKKAKVTNKQDEDLIAGYLADFNP